MSREEHNGIDSKAPKGSTANPGHKEIKNEDSVLLRQNIADEERYFHEQNLLKERHRQEEFNKKKDDYSIDDYIASYGNHGIISENMAIFRNIDKYIYLQIY